ncbi:hypothetical protein AAE02nite_44970 [Adhaeribacter aerolatus]|uniref:Lipoprotein n=1 Tax=Adhaeribacter aerolatus TaxID=670289 RepID=A0A512B4E0_9BACT|nr:hypothetical protein [Adhaeribacter aerolatus]GEO06833.1 hypothetical protein AAE02nite_44970 [Adhaeribacter aerolatus]
MRLYFYTLLLIALLTNCADGETTPSQIAGKINEEFTLKLNQTIQLTGGATEVQVANENPLLVQMIEAKDGSCPANATCIMSGFATVTLNVSQGKSYSDTIHLCLGDCNLYRGGTSGDTVEFRVGANQYVAILKSVESKSEASLRNVVQRVFLAVRNK